MIVVTLLSKTNKEIRNLNVLENKLVINCTKVAENANSFAIEIVFNAKIIGFRDHDYTWKDLKVDLKANEFTPKIIKLEDGNYVQANINQGIWEISKKNPYQLVWKFNPEFSKPITEYVGTTAQKRIYQASNQVVFIENPTLLFSKNGALEISRSKIPFSATACFTDHCDFDTAQNLKLQRQLFKESNIKVTKGFFLNHFSKRSDNASYQNDKDELNLWQLDGHELCYHSLSQSIKSDEESFSDFENFEAPFYSNVWIDHGFQPYNFTLFKKNSIDKSDYENQLFSKKINTLWNYIDSGSATKGVLNQLNTNHFTLNSFSKGIENFSFKTRIVQLFKNIIFHYDNDEQRVRNYIDTITHTKNVLIKRKFNSILPLIKNAIPLLKPVSKVIFFWNSEKNKPFKVAQYAPLVFKHTIAEKEFYVFQTIELVDFKKALHRQNIDSLIDEAGIFIAHTYFSVDMKHYSGKMFHSEGRFDEEVVANFHYLGSKITENKIWNPTLSELISYFEAYNQTIISVDDNGNIYLKNNPSLAIRTIH
ncbi:hypothetical protein [Flavobacterium aquatile]|uniref:Uncharacterized protein n=1 Tax=Flavobacterium aquatile LMG 4008 = ATCC 11947 TaxID=1453498 RepID=A0A095SUX5_9FLAO|nr:hypothetical protein [Flavobacterium aquatile]KGD68149.1 hypothetical protein LG45_07590 [Flavobacterium aquatile LMG 4008 = ATCC 11947]OXA68914.1 hypothetical protein B0A61_04200 [Flavobacterium aquatile LMG 4008 = ATCC 11947]GEC77381.1 hypothetical protein FAQ01_02510 [Flavobacterium aquatile]